MTMLVLVLALGATADPWRARFPDDDVVVISHETRLSIRGDGRSITWHRRVTRPLTLVGREDYSDVRIPYSASRQQVRVMRCATLLADGSVVEASAHAFNHVTPEGYGEAPDFLDCREVVVSPPAVAEGAEITLEYEVADSAVVPWFDSVIAIGERHPVLLRTVRVETHGAQSIAWATRHIEGACPTEDARSLTWVFHDLPAFPARDAGSHATGLVPCLAVSTCSDWGCMAGWWAERLPSDDQLPNELSDSLHVHLRRAVTRLDTLQAIVEAVPLRIVPAPDRRFRSCRVPSRIIETGYAEPLEAAWLLAALGRRMGFDATLCLVGDALDAGAPPASSLVPEAWVVVADSPARWMSPQGVRPSPRRDGPFAHVPLIAGGEPVIHPGPPVRRGHAVVVLTTGEDDSLSLIGSMTLSASLVPDGANPGRPEEWLAPRLKRIGKGLTPRFTCETLEEGGVAYRFEGSMPAEEAQWIDLSMAAWFGDGWIPHGSSVFDVLPRMPVTVPADVELRVVLRVEDSAGFEFFGAPESLLVGGTVASLRVRTDETGRSMRIERLLSLHAGLLDGTGVREVRDVVAAEGRRREASILVRPSTP
ncbi:MAG: DUF3857 domain-containing protein [Candidatus Eisenbacteria bacterium]|jgi:hypothetical protein|nr:DUF3857 domain-containing protein [Candidatus Eisenbacteria bacterium]